MKLLPAQALERSKEADVRRRADLDRVRRERVAAEGRLRWLYELIEEGLASARDGTLPERVAEHRPFVVQLEASERSLSDQLAAGDRRIEEAAVERFGHMVRERITIGDRALRRGCVRLFVSDVAVSNVEIAISGICAALEAALVHGDRAATPVVLIFDRNMVPRRGPEHLTAKTAEISHFQAASLIRLYAAFVP